MPTSEGIVVSLLRFSLVACALLLAACGGGSGGGGSESAGTPPPSGSPVPPNPVPPTPAPINHSPIVSRANERQQAIQFHPFSYDVTQNGTTFSDPDGDALTYEIVMGHVYNPYRDPDPPPGFRIEGTRIVGAPETLEAVIVTVTAKDPTGWTENNQFAIGVNPNAAPQAINPNADRHIVAGTHVDFETTQNGAVFVDPDGDALSYEVTMRTDPRGLGVTGTHVRGTFNSVGLVEVTVTASDIYGGSGSDVFVIAAPGPVPGRPALPAVSYSYADEELDLPHTFRLSSELIVPLWDTQPVDNRTSNAGATLGRVLFYDKRLSSTNMLSCSSCHVQSHGFASPERFNSGALGVPLKRNAMALANVRYQLHESWFSDMRVHALRDLVLMPIENSEELGNSLELLEAKLAATDFYPALFEDAFGTPQVTRERISRALAQFMQALISYRAKVDRALNPMTNDPWDPLSALNPQELRGFEIFSTNCSLCHEVHAQTNVWQANNGLDVVPADPGVQNEALRRDGSTGVFKAASLRNIALTAPYMHDGRFNTLREVIDHYDHGIKDSPNLDVILRDFNFQPRRMNFTEADKDALEAFLRTFTDDEFLNDPKFSDPFEP
jgi:cytochrome c peroxidase